MPKMAFKGKEISQKKEKLERKTIDKVCFVMI